MSAEIRDGLIFVDSDALADALIAADAAIRRRDGGAEADRHLLELRPARSLEKAAER
ncbi:MAG TPA: hypothetical protein VJP76_05735 [Candidatus Tumulicola sp.]|nr:hypothetical protein [Candidatus Tumulicola sp.]